MSSLDPQRWRRLRVLLDQAMDHDGAARLAFVDALSAEDAELREDLQRLLIQHARDEEESSLDPFAVMAPLILGSAEANAEEDRIGQQIGVYRLLRLIGSGGMGSVYLAERNTDNFVQRVALKVIRGEVATAAARERFERERQILARLVHPNIAPLYDGGQTPDGQPFYTMEYVDGVPITEYCNTRLDNVRARVKLLIDIAGALACAHQNLVVHRDIKPSNILVTAEGRAKLLDFGIAKPMGVGDAALTQAALGPMTPEYAAPEQFRNADVTVATDIYQFGVLCYRVLTGRLPYRADPSDTYAWSRAVSEDDPLKLRLVLSEDGNNGETTTAPGRLRLRRSISGDLDAILRKAMAKSPGDRYQSMDALAADLSAFLDGRPISARQMGALFYAWRFVVRRPIASSAALLAILGLIATTLIAVRQAEMKAHEAERANAEAKHADAVADFLIGLFKVSDPGVNRGEKLNANEILARGAEKIEHEFVDEPDQRIRLQTVMAEVYAAMGDYPRTQPLLEQAIATLRSQSTPDPAALGHNLQQLAWLKAQLNDLPSALTLFEEAEALLTGISTPNALDDLVSVHLHRGLAFLWQGNYALAERDTRRALTLAQQTRGADSEMAARAHQNLGMVLDFLGDSAASKAETEIAFETYRRTLGEDHPDTLAVAAAIGWSLAQAGDLTGARSALLDVVARQKKVLGESNNGNGKALNQLGMVELRLGLTDQAIEHFLAAEAVYRREFGSNSAYLVTPVMLNRGRALLAVGRFAEALELFQQVHAQRVKDLPPGHAELAESLMFMSSALLHLGRITEALDNAKKAVTILRATPSIDPLDLAKALQRLGLALKASGDISHAHEAWREALDIASPAHGMNSWLAKDIRRYILELDPTLATPPQKTTSDIE
ncbi:tetratricopeptide repeat protein [Pseudolysobacter antarcticus]|uniref:Tetratricopeptide repeat protein n=1 Tax=Pseudolysobacter antarcticus TaxID=2511995 RepID=A0A411HNB9_9GAMM|nr:serine/threonine-protein kinase [Pseudolysobacter antarcticus]QBB71956.1 tetratricopeptide repeat protein [Pseudolysobacter antarcticus]